jgi:hypothetical protein
METTTHTEPPALSGAKVRRSEAALKERGGRRMPNGMLQPDVAQALDALVTGGYAASPVAVISAALIDAQKKMQKSSKKEKLRA